MPGFRIGDFETASGQRIDIIDHGPVQIICAEWIDEHAHAVCFGDEIIRPPFIEHHRILHPRATAGFDVDTQDFARVFSLVADERLDLYGGVFGERNDWLRLNARCCLHYAKNLRLQILVSMALFQRIAVM